MSEPRYFADVAEQVPPTWGDDCVVGGYCLFGVVPMANAANRRPVKTDWSPGHIGSRTIIRHYCVIGAGVDIGEDCSLGNFVSIREGVTVGDRCVLGTMVDIQFNVRIADDVKIFNQTQITGNSSIGRGSFLGPGIQSANDPHIPHFSLKDYQHRGQTGIDIGEYVFAGVHATFLPGVKVGDGAVVAARANVTKDVPPGAFVVGNPARIVRKATDEDRALVAADFTERPACGAIAAAVMLG